jgi:hypothetical protein
MKQLLTISGLLLLSSLSFSCAGSNNSNEFVSLRTQLADSLIKWKSFKKMHNATYQFVTSASGNPPPNKTVITVENDRLVKRAHYETFDRRKLDESLAWLEDSPETLGEHTLYPLKKVDDYYEECSEILDYSENNSEKNQVSAGINFDKNGLIANCGDGAEAYDDGSHSFHILKITPTP